MKIKKSIVLNYNFHGQKCHLIKQIEITKKGISYELKVKEFTRAKREIK